MKIEQRHLRHDVAGWLNKRRRYLYPRWEVQVYDTSADKLSRFIEKYALINEFPCSPAFDFGLAITGVLRRGPEAQLVFVECKTSAITLKDLGPMQGYSAAALPVLSIIVSPVGMSHSLDLLLNTYNRVDLLDYGHNKRIKIATWDISRKQVDPASVLPAGELG
ncbi:MAG: hypothetical protein ACRD2L_01855 [Terriglobia bacterium]